MLPLPIRCRAAPSANLSTGPPREQGSDTAGMHDTCATVSTAQEMPVSECCLPCLHALLFAGAHTQNNHTASTAGSDLPRRAR